MFMGSNQTKKDLPETQFPHLRWGTAPEWCPGDFQDGTGPGYRKEVGFRKKYVLGLPCYSSSKESVCQSRGHRFDPWFGKIPHATRQLILCAAPSEPICAIADPGAYGTCALRRGSCHKEKPACCNWRRSPAAKTQCGENYTNKRNKS